MREFKFNKTCPVNRSYQWNRWICRCHSPKRSPPGSFCWGQRTWSHRKTPVI